MIISVMNNKGGCGKTTTATILTELASRQLNVRVLAADTDSETQQAFFDNLNVGDAGGFLANVDVLPCPDRTPPEAQLREYDFAIIDTPPRTDSRFMKKIIEYSDVIVVPFKPEKHDLFGLDEMAKLIPDEKPVILLCLMPPAKGEAHVSNLEIAERVFPGAVFQWKMPLRVLKNIERRKPFDWGLPQKDKAAYSGLFEKIRKLG